MATIIGPIDGRPHHYRALDEDGNEVTVVTRDGLLPEEVLREIAVPTDPSYRERRAQEYPSIAEQLDMLYHDPDAWRAMIAEIKARHPKA